MMLPVLQASSSGEIGLADIRKIVADKLGLSADDLAEPKPSGKGTNFVNRTAWAIFYLERAGLLDRSTRGIYRTSGSGQSVLDQNPAKVDLKFLERFPKYLEWRHKSVQPDSISTVIT